MRAKDFRRMARHALRGNWVVAVLAGFLASLLGGSVAYHGSENSAFSSSMNVITDMFTEETQALPESSLITLSVILIVFVAVMLLYALALLVIGGAVSLGYARFNLKLTDGEKVQVSDLFSQLHRLGSGFLMRFLVDLYTALWSLLFFIPGIVKSYSYSMTTYILYENPGMSVNEAITQSRRLMNGNKWRLFCLDLSFFGWSMLCALPVLCGMSSFLLSLYFNPLILAGNPFAILWLIPILFVTYAGYWFLMPYMEAARAAFYRGICRETAANTADTAGEA